MQHAKGFSKSNPSDNSTRTVPWCRPATSAGFLLEHASAIPLVQSGDRFIAVNVEQRAQAAD